MDSRHFLTVAIAIVGLTFVAVSLALHPQAMTEEVEWWGVRAYQPDAAERRESLRLELFEFILSQEITQIRNEVVFVSVGRDEEWHWIVPPEELIERLSSLADDVRSVADATMRTSSDPMRFPGVVSKASGRAGHVRYVDIVEWLDENTARVSYGLYGGPLYGGGTIGAVYRYEDGDWTLVDRGSFFISSLDNVLPREKRGLTHTHFTCGISRPGVHGAPSLSSSFVSVDDVQRVPGIGPKTLAAMRPHLMCVLAPAPADRAQAD